MTVQRFDLFDGAMGLSLATVHNGTVRVSGMIGLNDDFATVPTTVEEQMRNAYAHIATILANVNAEIASIVDQTIYFVGEPEPTQMAWDNLRSSLFADGLPAVTMVGVARLTDPRCLVEIKVVAATSS
jgi:enamine deaminase RidA (YjgF/YER057c/UK114 family)